MIKFFKKYHKWLGIVLTVFIVLFALSGIILNHRSWVSSIDVKRSILPKEYHFSNWNNAALKGACNVSPNQILIYGNVGVWQTDSLYHNFSDFNQGLPKGTDNLRISKIYQHHNRLYAGTRNGLYRYNKSEKQWVAINLPTHEQNVVDIISKEDSLLVMTRSNLLLSSDGEYFQEVNLPLPDDYDNKMSLFKTLWIIHSGEILGIAGRLLMDFAAITLIFLSISGLIFFINRYRIKGRNKKAKDNQHIKRSSRWNLRWHNKIGWITALLLIIVTATGIFLRPPLLIAITSARVSKIPFSSEEQQSPWHDKLRAIRYDDASGQLLLSTSEGMYRTQADFSSTMQGINPQPPVSVMGITVFEKTQNNTWLIGSFSGLFEWDAASSKIYDYIEQQPYIPTNTTGRPVGNYMVSGYIKEKNTFFDYRNGAQSLNKDINFSPMPKALSTTKMPLWNLALEIHTARIYKVILGDFYILIVPLAGLSILFILISGFIIWLRKRSKKL